MLTNDKMLKKTYSTPDEYVLETLEENEEIIFEELFKNIPQELTHQFNRYIEIHSFISRKQIEIAYNNGRKDGFEMAKEIIIDDIKKVGF